MAKLSKTLTVFSKEVQIYYINISSYAETNKIRILYTFWAIAKDRSIFSLRSHSFVSFKQKNNSGMIFMYFLRITECQIYSLTAEKFAYSSREIIKNIWMLITALHYKVKCERPWSLQPNITKQFQDHYTRIQDHYTIVINKYINLKYVLGNYSLFR